METEGTIVEKLVFISSPYAGNVEANTAFAKAACLFAVKQGVVPIAVHLMYPQILDDRIPTEREKGLDMGRRVLEACDELWIFGERISAGMWQEWEAAEKLGIPVRMVSSDEVSVFLEQVRRQTYEWNVRPAEMEMKRC